MSALLEVDHYDDATRGFGASLYIEHSHSSVYHDGWENARLMDCPVIFTVLLFEKIVASYGGKGSIGQYKAVFMDGSNCVFKAQFNTGVTSKLKGVTLHPGTSITVKKYHWVWQSVEYSGGAFSDGELGRGVMIVDAFDWRDAPVQETVDSSGNDAVTTISVDFEVEFVDEVFVKKTYKSNSLFFMKLVAHEEEAGVLYLSSMNNDDMKRGLFIENQTKRSAWVSAMKKRAREDDSLPAAGTTEAQSCECVTLFGMTQCMGRVFPIENISIPELWDSVKTRLNDQVDRPVFQEIHPRKQRWCFYWWYAINLFSVKCSSSRQLPKCFCDYIREKYPNPEGEAFVGYKTSEQLRDEKNEESIARMMAGSN